MPVPAARPLTGQGGLTERSGDGYLEMRPVRTRKGRPLQAAQMPAVQCRGEFRQEGGV